MYRTDVPLEVFPCKTLITSEAESGFLFVEGRKYLWFPQNQNRETNLSYNRHKERKTRQTLAATFKHLNHKYSEF